MRRIVYTKPIIYGIVATVQTRGVQAVKKQLFLFFGIMVVVSIGLTSCTVSAVTPAENGWYEIDKAPRATPEFERELAVREHYIDRAKQCLDALPQDLRSRVVENFTIAVFDPVSQGMRVTSPTADIPALGLPPTKVVLYGSVTENAGLLVASFFYEESWGAVFMPAVRMTDDWFCATLVHEFAHARAHRERSGKIVYDDSARIREEISLHELERKVLDQRTEGRYVAALRTAVLKANESSYITLLMEVDSIFEQAPSDVEQRIRYSQIMFDLEFLKLEQQGIVAEEARFNVYRMLSNQ